MGGGSWDDSVYSRQIVKRRKSGQDDFLYDAGTRSKLDTEWKAHPDLDPRKIKGERESRDSDEHPTSRAIAVFFDVTGSMRDIPRVLQTKLGKLMDLIKNKGGIEHPQIMVGAIGDTKSDRVPLQVGQFESDNRIDEQLRLFFLEGNGGGQVHESYGLAHYIAGWKTALDCWEKRQEKGYLFTIGDEMPWSPITGEEIRKTFGTGDQADITIEAAVKKASEKFEVFHILATGGSHGREARVLNKWRSLLGERVLLLDNADNVCELIVSTIALVEGNVSSDNPAAGMGFDKQTSNSVDQALKDLKKKSGSGAPADKKKKTGRI